MSANLFSPLQLGPLTLKNRVFLAPLTRGRAEPDGTPNLLMGTYYAQRATGGLLISEATAISPQGYGWVQAPGIWTDRHEAGWREITTLVHEAGSRIFLQLWHMGRQSHPDFQGGALPVAPSAIGVDGTATTPEGRKPYVTPRALEASELPGVVADYAAAAERAIRAGFDGVEIHGANGYLLDEFLRDGANHRTDAYGGSVENRWRFPLEVVDAVVGAIGAERTGIRLSPLGRFGGMSDSDPLAVLRYGAAELAKRGVVYLHLVDPAGPHVMVPPDSPRLAPVAREVFDGVIVVNGGYDRDSGDAVIASGDADAVAFGTSFLANPDLPLRLVRRAPLNPPDPSTFYTHDEEGYTTYPTMGIGR